jgi:co-chaperonin GroES (HSP10)
MTMPNPSIKGPVSQISRINPEEEAEARQLIADEMNNLGVEKLPTPCGYWICVKTYIRSDVLSEIKTVDGQTVTLYNPLSAQQEDRYTSIAALVIAVGPDAYRDKARFPEPWCKVGDWVIVPRNEGFPFIYGGVPMQMIYDDKIVCVIEGPELVTNTAMTTRARV